MQLMLHMAHSLQAKNVHPCSGATLPRCSPTRGSEQGWATLRTT